MPEYDEKEKARKHWLGRKCGDCLFACLDESVDDIENEKRCYICVLKPARAGYDYGHGTFETIRNDMNACSRWKLDVDPKYQKCGSCRHVKWHSVVEGTCVIVPHGPKITIHFDSCAQWEVATDWEPGSQGIYGNKKWRGK